VSLIHVLGQAHAGCLMVLRLWGGFRQGVFLGSVSDRELCQVRTHSSASVSLTIAANSPLSLSLHVRSFFRDLQLVLLSLVLSRIVAPVVFSVLCQVAPVAWILGVFASSRVSVSSSSLGRFFLLSIVCSSSLSLVVAPVLLVFMLGLLFRSLSLHCKRSLVSFLSSCSRGAQITEQVSIY
jgi:hypothetical protein